MQDNWGKCDEDEKAIMEYFMQWLDYPEESKSWNDWRFAGKIKNQRAWELFLVFSRKGYNCFEKYQWDIVHPLLRAQRWIIFGGKEKVKDGEGGQVFIDTSSQQTFDASMDKLVQIYLQRHETKLEMRRQKALAERIERDRLERERIASLTRDNNGDHHELKQQTLETQNDNDLQQSDSHEMNRQNEDSRDRNIEEGDSQNGDGTRSENGNFHAINSPEDESKEDIMDKTHEEQMIQHQEFMAGRLERMERGIDPDEEWAIIQGEPYATFIQSFNTMHNGRNRFDDNTEEVSDVIMRNGPIDTITINNGATDHIGVPVNHRRRNRKRRLDHNNEDDSTLPARKRSRIESNHRVMDRAADEDDSTVSQMNDPVVSVSVSEMFAEPDMMVANDVTLNKIRVMVKSNRCKLYIPNNKIQPIVVQVINDQNDEVCIVQG